MTFWLNEGCNCKGVHARGECPNPPDVIPELTWEDWELHRISPIQAYKAVRARTGCGLTVAMKAFLRTKKL